MTTATVEDTKTETKLADGIEHLGGTLYRVPYKLIEVADVDPKADSVQFFNPRNMISIVSEQKPAGCDAESMSSLRERIRTQGLHNPLTCRWIVRDGVLIPQIVNGERRWRSVGKLRADKGAKAFNASTKEMEPANKVYEYVECRIWHMDDVEAFRVANSGNSEAVPMGDACDAAQIRYFRQRGCTDEQILAYTEKSKSWLVEMDMINKLDDKSFKSLANNAINRTVALTLSKIDNVDERLEKLDNALQIASARVNKVKLKLTEDIAAAEKKAAIASGEALIAKKTGNNDAVKAAEKKKAAAEGKIAATKKKLSTVKAKVKTSDLKKAAGETKPLTAKKIEKKWMPVLSTAINQRCQTEDNESIGYDFWDAKLAKSLSEAILKGEEDVAKVLKIHTRNKERAANSGK